MTLQERHCGTEQCIVPIVCSHIKEDIKDNKDEIKALKESYLKLIDVVSKQDNIIYQLKTLQDKQEEVNNSVFSKLDSVVTVNYFKWALSFATFIILLLSFVFNYIK